MVFLVAETRFTVQTTAPRLILLIQSSYAKQLLHDLDPWSLCLSC